MLVLCACQTDKHTPTIFAFNIIFASLRAIYDVNMTNDILTFPPIITSLELVTREERHLPLSQAVDDSIDVSCSI